MAGESYVGTAYTFQTRVYNKQIWLLGANGQGSLGQNNRTAYSSPVQVPGSDWVEGGIGSHTVTLSIKSDGTLWCMGNNDQGQLGQNNRTLYSSPVQIPGTTWSKVRFSGGSHNCLATKTDGTLWSWGYNGVGGLGQNNETAYSSPVQVGSETTWTDNFDSGHNNGYGIKTDGTLWSWGYNTWGGLGNSATTHRSSPVQIPGSNWNTVRDYYFSAMATKTDGTLWVWGYNGHGSLGQNQAYSASSKGTSSPVQIPGTNWDQLGSALYGGMATKTDGTLWMWGQNNQGQLGQNNTTQYSSPVQIPGTTWSSGWRNNDRDVHALKTDGTLWNWGYNDNGWLGQNNRTNYSSPVQIPGTWSWISGGGQSGVLIGKNA